MYVLDRLQPDEWPLYKALRLEALQNEPGKFGAAYTKVLQQTDDEWHAKLVNPQEAFFKLLHHDTPIGMTGVVQYAEDPQAVLLIASYIQLAHRGKGLAKMLYEARLKWAREQGYKRAVISHRVDNLPSKASILKHGFVYTRTEANKEWPDGTVADSLFYGLDL